MPEPELRLLRAFVQVAEQLSFTRAAETLYLRQQTVSKMIRELERQVGVELLERTTREVHVTPAGQALLRHGRAVLAAADDAFASARRIGTGHDGTVRVGATVAIGPTDRADIVQALRDDRPDLAVTFQEVTPGDLVEALISRRVDYALTRTVGITDVRVAWAELRPTPAVICLPAGHRLSGRTAVSAAELDGENLLIPSAVGRPYADLLLSSFAAAGAVVGPVLSRVTGGAVMLSEVDQRSAVAVMPVGTFCPPGVVDVAITDFVLPLRAVWSTEHAPESIERLRRIPSHRYESSQP